MPVREEIPGLPERLKAMREKAGLSQDQAATLAGVNRVSIARFETDKRVPTLGVLYKLAEAYGVDVCDLLPKATDSGPAEPPVVAAPAPPPSPPAKKPKKK